MNNAILCWRPYHVFSAINIVKNDIENTQGNTVLFLYDYANIVHMKAALEKTGLFNEVIVINDYKQKAEYLKKIIGLFFSKQALKHHVESVPDAGFVFDKIISTSSNVIFFEFVHANPYTKIVLFEDGTLAYVANEIEHGMNTHLRRIRWLLKIIMRKATITSKYVYEPRLVMSEDYPLKSLPRINDKVDAIQKRVFEYDKQVTRELYREKQIIYLDERYPDDYYKDNMREEDVFNLLTQYQGKVILRPHPGDGPGTNMFDIDTAMQSWELTCRDALSEDSVLVTKTSTASITPFLLYGINAHIVFLSDMLFKKTEGEENIIQGISDKLRYKKIYRPKTIQEFSNVLRSIIQ